MQLGRGDDPGSRGVEVMLTVEKTRDDLVAWLETQPVDREWDMACLHS